MKRSTCASGSGYVPSDSIGFCVASTMNGAGTGCVVWPIVTCRSCITSSSADCTFAGRAVDLVGEQEVAEHRAELRLELVLVGTEDPRADEVARNEVGRELDARERAAEHRGGRLDRERLREARHALDQEVAAREQADEHPLEHRLLAGDHAPDLEERLLELLQQRVGRGFLQIGHHVSSCSLWDMLDRMAGPLGAQGARPAQCGATSSSWPLSRTSHCSAGLATAARTRLAFTLVDSGILPPKDVTLNRTALARRSPNRSLEQALGNRPVVGLELLPGEDEVEPARAPGAGMTVQVFGPWPDR